MSEEFLGSDLLVGCWLEKDIEFQRLHNPFDDSGLRNLKKWWATTGVYEYSHATNILLGIAGANIFFDENNLNEILINNRSFDEFIKILKTPIISESCKLKLLKYLLETENGIPNFAELLISERVDLVAALKSGNEKIIWWNSHGVIEYAASIGVLFEIISDSSCAIEFLENEFIKITRGLFLSIFTRYGLIFDFNNDSYLNIAKSIIRFIEDSEPESSSNFGLYTKKEAIYINQSVNEFLRKLVYFARDDLCKKYTSEYDDDYIEWFNRYGIKEYQITIKKLEKILDINPFNIGYHLDIKNKLNVVMVGIHDEVSGISIEAKNVEKSLHDKNIEKIYFKNNKINIRQYHDCKSIFVGSPFSLNDFYLRYGECLGSNLFGYLPWEFNVINEYFFKNIPRGLENIWTCSSFSASAFKCGFKNTDVIPVNIDLCNYRQENTRLEFGLIESTYYFLVIFDGLSSINRKNPYCAIDAFKMLDNSDKKFGLIVKTHNLKIKQLSEMYEYCRGYNISIINESYSKQAILDLISSVNCLVSTHRVEGFGRVMAEAMYLGVPVIASRYSGNLDYMNDENSYLIDGDIIFAGEFEYQSIESSSRYFWFNPSSKSAGELMLKAYEESTINSKRITLAKNIIKSNYGPNNLKLFLDKYI